MYKSNLKTFVIITLDNSKKEDLQISTPETKISIPIIKQIALVIISLDVYCMTCSQKKA